ncbi:MAG TPA: NlpC/P60 family protein [Candidatus Paceibacterota bacterium]|nr:NlpC/P60 family protein [Candidatus Paceibacterota bacterium]
MHLSSDQQKVIIETALSRVGEPYRRGFRCVDFVRIAYRSAGIEIPPLRPYAPPRGLNIGRTELADPPPGRLMFLKDRDDPRKERAWTHIVILIGGRDCVHCSYFSGCVAVSSLDEIALRYDFAESA